MMKKLTTVRVSHNSSPEGSSRRRGYRRTTGLMVLAVICAVLAAGLSMPATADARADKVEVCHRLGNGTYRLLRLPPKAAQKRIDKHGDGVPGHPVPGVAHFDFGEDCVPELKVAIAFDLGGLGDNSFNDIANRGIIEAATDFRVKVLQTTVTDPSDHVRAFSELAEQDPAIVFGVGFPFEFAANAVAPLYANTNFVVLDSFSASPQPNVQSAAFKENEGSFLVGVVAALTSTSDHVGFIGGVSGFGLIEKFEAGFTAGVLAVSPGATVDVTYLSAFPEFSGFFDPVKAYQEATTMYTSGADVIYHASGGSGFGLFAAASDYSTSNPSVWAIGVDSDQFLLVPSDQQPHILTSMLKRLDSAVYDAIADEANGENFQSGIVTRGLAENGVNYATSGGFVDGIVPQLEALRQDIIDGTIVVPLIP